MVTKRVRARKTATGRHRLDRVVALLKDPLGGT
jgi:hypothetical protein